MTRAEMAARRAAIARHAETCPRWAVAEYWDITESRVGQIVKRVREDERKARCARGGHGERVRRRYVVTVVSPVNGTTELRTVPRVTCKDCGAEVEP